MKRFPGGSTPLFLTVSVVTLVLLLPVAALIACSASEGISGIWRLVTTPVALAAYRLSFTAAALAAVVNASCGTLVAWVLVRYRFPMREAANALVDLPLALPTAVAGITLSEIYTPARPLGAFLERVGLPIAFAPAGIVLAMTFVSLPFVVRSIQPVLLDLEKEVEEAAHSLGATRAQTFRHVILPSIVPAVLSGVALSFARAVGEYGSVVLVSGNVPLKSLVAPVFIFQLVEEDRAQAAAVIATVLLLASLALLVALNAVQRWRVARGL